MAAGDVETFHADGKWWNRVEGQPDRHGPSTRRSRRSPTDATRARNLKVEHIIRGLDGRIRGRNSYGNDPRTTPR